jgi:hypothetical protein
MIARNMASAASRRAAPAVFGGTLFPFAIIRPFSNLERIDNIDAIEDRKCRAHHNANLTPVTLWPYME